MNRWALGIYGFAFPVLLTMTHMGFSFCVLLPLMLTHPSFKTQHRTTLKRQWKGLLCIGAFMAMNIGLNNLSLVEISLSLNQVIRASLPVVTAAAAVLVERKVPTRGELLALLLLTCGVVVAIFEGQASGNGFGIALCVAGTLCSAGMMTTASKILSEKLDVLLLTFYTAPVSCCVLMPFFYSRELDRFRVYAHLNGPAAAAIVVCGSGVALAYNVVHNILLQRTSAVTVTVLGEVKIVGLLALSTLLLPGESSQFTLKMSLGCICAIAGFCLYSNIKLIAARKSAAETAAKQAWSAQDRESLLSADQVANPPMSPAPPSLSRTLNKISSRPNASSVQSPRTGASSPRKTHHVRDASISIRSHPGSFDDASAIS
ncbi:hypothetical protein WJX72_010960 [[Myrmecia] bisecta]|uniref:Sugar phosphate transporter domain-containing protein n=1 Tax=[Myrmecia] bisecta TaxID=41462 RepID=A0AAW1PB39_9CHLO